MTLVVKRLNEQTLAEIELGERVVTGMVLENYKPRLQCALTIAHRFYVANLRSMGFNLVQLADGGTTAIMPIKEGPRAPKHSPART